MQNSATDFFGKQTDERILYVVYPHSLATTFKLVKIVVVGIAVFAVLAVLGTQIPSFSTLFLLSGATTKSATRGGTAQAGEAGSRSAARCSRR